MWRYSKDLKVSLADPGAGHEHRPNGRGTYYGVEIATNSAGWRDREYTPTSDQYRIMVLGASVVMGWGVEEGQGFTKVLERRLNVEGYVGKPGKAGVQVINTGIGNYNTEMQVSAFFRKGVHFNPDEVLLLSYVSDSQVTHQPTSPWLYPLMRTYLYGVVADRWINLRSRLDPEWNCLSFYAAVNQPGSPGRASMERAIERLADYCRTRGIALWIVVLPELHQFRDYPFAAVTDTMRAIGRRCAVGVVDLLPFFVSEDPRQLWLAAEDPHPNARGHAIIAQGIHDLLFRSPPVTGPNLTDSPALRSPK
jgi:lysophospholipase L1-like esterase